MAPAQRDGSAAAGLHSLRLAGVKPIGVEVGKVIGRYMAGKHFEVTMTDTALTIERRQDQIDAEATLDGFYVLRTPVPADESTRPAWYPPTRTSNTSSTTSGTSKATTWTCAPSSTGSKKASGPTC
jgi:hypothetical protein